MSDYYEQAPKRLEKITILRKWYCVFNDNIGSDIKLGVNESFVKFKDGSGYDKRTIKFLGSFFIVGEIYNGDYPDGRRINTHLIKSVCKITDPAIVEKVRRNRRSDTVLCVSTDRNENYYLCLSSNGNIFGGNQ